MISIIISWRDREELSGSLPSMVEAAQNLGGNITIVNFGGSDQLLLRQIESFEKNISIVQVANQRYFNKSAAQNVGASYTNHPFLFFTDCDIILQNNALDTLLDQVIKNPKSFATLAKVRESKRNSRGGKHVTCFGYHLLIRTADNRELQIIDNEEDASDGSRQAPGLLLVRRTDFESINGYNSRLHGWGWEDQDMIARLTLGLGLERIIAGEAIHISHDDTARVAHYPISNRWESRDKMFRQALENYDKADFLGTFSQDRNIVAQKISNLTFDAKV